MISQYFILGAIVSFLWLRGGKKLAGHPNEVGVPGLFPPEQPHDNEWTTGGASEIVLRGCTSHFARLSDFRIIDHFEGSSFGAAKQIDLRALESQRPGAVERR